MKQQFKGFVAGFLVCLLLMGTVFAGGLEKTIDVVFNSVNIAVNGEKVEVDNILYNGTTYAPLRAVADMLGKEVGWEGETRTATINDPVVEEKENSRTNPGKIGDTFSVTHNDFLDGEQKYDITLVDLKSGEEAWKMVEEGNMFNDPAPEGKEYILAKFTIKVTELENEPMSINHAKFDVISEKGVQYTDFVSVSGLKPNLSTELYAGSEFTGWTYFLVDKDDNPVTAINRKSDGEVWFSLRK